MRAHLIPLDGGDPIELLRPLTLVGRKDDCDLRLNHKSVSKQHCVLVKADGLVLLRDLGSTNGTRVNGTRVRRAALLSDDQLAIAGAQFKVRVGPDAPPPRDERTLRVDAIPADGPRPGELSMDEPEGAPDPSLPPVQTNDLPDVYPPDV